MQIKHAFITLAIAAQPFVAFAEGLVAVELEQGNLPLKLVVDGHRTIKVKGLPKGLNIHFNARSGTLFANIDGEGTTYTTTLGIYGKNIPTARVKAGEEWRPYEGHPSRYWQIQVQGEICTHAYANVRAASKAGIDYTDLSRLLASLSYLVGPPREAPCGPYLIGRADGKIMGLPLYTVSKDDKNSEISEIVAEEGDFNRLYTESTKPLDPEAHVRFLKLMLTGQERSAFENASQNLPWAQQVKALKALLDTKRDFVRKHPDIQKPMPAPVPQLPVVPVQPNELDRLPRAPWR